MFLFCIYTGIASAQETRQQFIGAEAGMAFIESEMPNMDYIRGEIASYSVLPPFRASAIGFQCKSRKRGRTETRK